MNKRRGDDQAKGREINRSKKLWYSRASNAQAGF
jgi:hypothetical protein